MLHHNSVEVVYDGVGAIDPFQWTWEPGGDPPWDNRGFRDQGEAAIPGVGYIGSIFKKDRQAVTKFQSEERKANAVKRAANSLYDWLVNNTRIGRGAERIEAASPDGSKGVAGYAIPIESEDDLFEVHTKAKRIAAAHGVFLTVDEASEDMFYVQFYSDPTLITGDVDTVNGLAATTLVAEVLAGFHPTLEVFPTSMGYAVEGIGVVPIFMALKKVGKEAKKAEGDSKGGKGNKLANKANKLWQRFQKALAKYESKTGSKLAGPWAQTAVPIAAKTVTAKGFSVLSGMINLDPSMLSGDPNVLLSLGRITRGTKGKLKSVNSLKSTSSSSSSSYRQSPGYAPSYRQSPGYAPQSSMSSSSYRQSPGYAPQSSMSSSPQGQGQKGSKQQRMQAMMQQMMQQQQQQQQPPQQPPQQQSYMQPPQEPYYIDEMEPEPEPYPPPPPVVIRRWIPRSSPFGPGVGPAPGYGSPALENYSMGIMPGWGGWGDTQYPGLGG